MMLYNVIMHPTCKSLGWIPWISERKSTTSIVGLTNVLTKVCHESYTALYVRSAACSSLYSYIGQRLDRATRL
jgi:hypothetical protein